MGKFDSRGKVPGGESHENHSNVGFSGKDQNRCKKLAASLPYFSDPLLIPRINQYLAENKDKVYIDINDMVSGLQSRYREYARRKRNIFRQAVQKAFNTILQQCALTSNLPDQDDKFGDEYLSTDHSSSDVEECSGENKEKLNSSNNQLMNLYKSARQNMSENFQKSPGQNAELIDLSSDDENVKKKDGEEKSVCNETAKNGVETTHNNAEKTFISAQPNISNKSSTVGEKQEKAGMPRKRKLNALLEKMGAKQKRISFQEPKVKFADFGGNAKALEEVCKLILHIRHPEFYRQIGLTSPRGFLLHGPPGCGKTLLASAIAGELEVRFLKVSAPELVGGVSGESEERIRELFDSAVESAPCVLFIDEVDAITPNRQNAQREMERRIVAQLLTCLDELGNATNGDQVLVIGATNRPDSLDPALRRAGRFDREVCLGIPDLKAREQILRVVCKNLKMAPNFPYEEIAMHTPGFVGADLLALAREAAMASVNRVFEAVQSRSGEKGAKRKKIKLDNSKGDKEILTSDISMDHEIDVKPKIEGNTCQVQTTNENKDADSKEEKVDNGDGGECDKMETKEKRSEEQKEAQPSKVLRKQKECSDMDIEETASEDSMSCEISKDESLKGLCTEDESEVELMPESYQSEPPSVETLLLWLRNIPPLTETQLEKVYLTKDDFRWALRCVQPSAKREGFATVPDVTWDDIGSLAEIREELKLSILGPVKMRKQFEQLGLTAPSGILICGPPGCGKTLLAKAVANEAGINFISVKGPELLNMYVGESERAVRQCFQRARSSAPCVIFFDELDALCPKRSSSGENGASMRVVNQMLTEMDGVEERKEVYLMAATNRPDIVDPAVLRPGRLDKVLYVGLPEAEDRIDILKALTKNGKRPKLAANVKLEVIAMRPECDGYSGADLAALVREAGVQALKDMISKSNLEAESNVAISLEHFERALKIVRPSVSPEDRKHYESLKEKYCSST